MVYFYIDFFISLRQSIINTIWYLFKENHNLFWEILIFITFMIMAFYRRKLSSNNEYRSLNAVKKYPEMLSTPTQALILETIRLMTNKFILPKYNSKKTVVTSSRLRSYDFLSSLQIARCSTKVSVNFPTSVEKSSEKSQECSQHHIFMKLSDDIMFKIIDNLSMIELVTFSGTCYGLNLYLRSDIVWKHLWMIRFGAMWKHEKIRQLCQMRGISWNPMNDVSHDSFCTSASSTLLLNKKSKLKSFSQTKSENNLEINNKISVNYNHSDSCSGSECNFNEPRQGWMRFYIDFEYCWIDWLLAGFNTETMCLIGLHGCILDVTSFLNEHPGSPETITNFSGCDVSLVFNEIGHSSFARSLLKKFIYWCPSLSPSIGNREVEEDTLVNNTSLIIDDIHEEHHFVSNLFSISSGFSQISSPLPSSSTVTCNGNINNGLLTAIHTFEENYYNCATCRPFGWTKFQEFMSKKQKLLQVCVADSNNEAFMSRVQLNPIVVCNFHSSTSPSHILNTNCCPFVAPDNSKIDQPPVPINSSCSSSSSSFSHRGTAEFPTNSLNHHHHESVSATTARKARHTGQPRVVYDPCKDHWLAWWTCCGKSYVCY